MTVYFRPCRDITKAPTPRGLLDTEMREFISEKTGLEISIDPTVDFEDWTEPATLLAAALHAGLEVSILPSATLLRAVANPVVTVPGKPCRDMLIGRPNGQDAFFMKHFDFGWPQADGWRANHYAELETFWRHAGRKVALADMPGDREAAGIRLTTFSKGLESGELGETMQGFAAGDLLVKQVYPAKEIPLIEIHRAEDFTPEDGRDAFFGKVGLHFARFEGDPAALLVQERITMTHETRVFVIGHKIITAAACIEAHTPNVHETVERPVLHPVFEMIRNSGVMDERPTCKRQQTADQLLAFAQNVVDEIADEAPKLDVYVLDVALDGEGKPLIVELNPMALANAFSGLYGSDAITLFNAIHAYSEAAPRLEPKTWCREDYVDMPAPVSQATAPSQAYDASLEDMEDYVEGSNLHLVSDDFID